MIHECVITFIFHHIIRVNCAFSVNSSSISNLIVTERFQVLTEVEKKVLTFKRRFVIEIESDERNEDD